MCLSHVLNHWISSPFPSHTAEWPAETGAQGTQTSFKQASVVRAANLLPQNNYVLSSKAKQIHEVVLLG